MRATWMICLGALLPLCATIVSAQATAQTNTALFEQSYSLSQTLGGTERVYYLSELTRLISHINPPPEMAEDLCLTLLRVASAEKTQGIRIAGQKNALAHLSYLDPALAMSLFPTLEMERPDANGMLSEDLRSDAAEEIFVNYLVKFKQRGLTAITAQARYLGRTGQYPYRAISSIIRQLPRLSNSDVNTLLNDALGSYRSETGFYNRDEEFLVLLQALNELDSSQIDNQLMAQAVSVYVNRLTNDSITFPGSYYSEIHTAGGVVSFTDRNRAFLFQLFPVVRRFNPDLATKLQAASPELSQASGNMSYVSGGFVMGDPTSDQATRNHLEWLQESLLDRISDRQYCDPQSAAKFAQRLTDVKARIVGFSRSVPGIARQSSSEARRVYNAQLSEFKVLSDPSDKLAAMVALSQAANYVGDAQQYRTLSAAAMETGVSHFLRDTTAVGSIRARKGFAQLEELVTFTSTQPEDSLKLQVQQLPDGWLKAYLLLYEADGHMKLLTPTLPPSCPDKITASK